MRWKAQYAEFRAACERGWDLWNCPKAEKALIKRAEGFRYMEKTIEVNPDTKKQTKVIRYHKYYPPDVAAIKTLLTSRRPDRYQDKQHVEHEGNITVQTVDYAKAKEEDS